MIVQPGFFDHWKTKLLVTLTGDKAAPLMILRLWAYCQTKRACKFEGMSDLVLAGICQSEKPTGLKTTLVKCGFLENDQNAVVVHDWESVNTLLLNSWNNGSKGGRPTHGLSTGIPRLTPKNPPNLILSKDKIFLKKDGGIPMGYSVKSDPTLPPPDPDAAKKFGQQLSELTSKIKSKTSETPQPPGL